MSNTRHATKSGPMRQERYASSLEYERGLIASMVARRCSVLDAATDRELIWWLHFMSHRAGGLKALVADLLASHGGRLGTAAMRKLGKRSGNYSADQVQEIRAELPPPFRRMFLLKGEDFDCICGFVSARDSYAEMFNGEAERRIAEADRQPTSYAVAAFETLCRRVAEDGDVESDCLEDELRQLCLDPAQDLATASPWYFAELVPTLRDYMQSWIAKLQSKTVVTELGQKVYDVLDYTAHSRSMTLIEGISRIGKSCSAEHWSNQHAGGARFIEVPTGNDETGFFRALARGLGLGNFTQYKAGEIRERVESVLLTGDLILVLDEAHRLLPQMNMRYGYPKRIEWLLSMVNAGVPVCLIVPLPTPVNGVPASTFMERLVLATQNTGWNHAQFVGRLGRYETLPNELSLEDLMAVAAVKLPESTPPARRALAAYARLSAKYLGAIKEVAGRASFIASKTGRNEATTEDIQKAMAEVVPSDSKVADAVSSATRRKSRKLPATKQPQQPLIHREIAPPDAGPFNRLAGEALEIAGKG